MEVLTLSCTEITYMELAFVVSLVIADSHLTVMVQHNLPDSALAYPDTL